MTLEDFYFISQIVAALAVAVSLIFVGLQVRQGNELAKEAAEQTRQTNLIAQTEFSRSMSEDIAKVWLTFGTDQQFLKIMPRALNDETDFTPAEWDTALSIFQHLNDCDFDRNDGRQERASG